MSTLFPLFRIYIKGALLRLRQFLATEDPLRMMENGFYFPLEILFVLKIFRFCFKILVMYKNDLIRKIGLISKFMRSQPD